jgi:hypothetical protein
MLSLYKESRSSFFAPFYLNKGFTLLFETGLSFRNADIFLLYLSRYRRSVILIIYFISFSLFIIFCGVGVKV